MCGSSVIKIPNSLLPLLSYVSDIFYFPNIYSLINLCVVDMTAPCIQRPKRYKK